MKKSSELTFVLKKLGKIKINSYRPQGVLTFNTRVFFLLLFFLFLNIIAGRHFYSHHINSIIETQKSEKIQTKISELKKFYKSNTPISSTCIDSECCYKQLINEIKNYFNIKSPKYYQQSNYYLKIVILNKLISKILRPPIL
ncbi:hypothetical protein [Fluviispira multicolorata]|uniref:Uncharacterized protein n=1 Tax=Fluviispira multicolorata TaxID=2654512 RepID=A0A833JDN2_9BACT|nr:hypothetical protein [Fluviispira multicolorata]KAB8031005.1 hypothetical protein GCL57_08540 [Fluviispira multicolorata]